MGKRQEAYHDCQNERCRSAISQRDTSVMESEQTQLTLSLYVVWIHGVEMKILGAWKLSSS